MGEEGGTEVEGGGEEYITGGAGDNHQPMGETTTETVPMDGIPPKRQTGTGKKGVLEEYAIINNGDEREGVMHCEKEYGGVLWMNNNNEYHSINGGNFGQSQDSPLEDQPRMYANPNITA